MEEPLRFPEVFLEEKPDGWFVKMRIASFGPMSKKEAVAMQSSLSRLSGRTTEEVSEESRKILRKYKKSPFSKGPDPSRRWS